MTASILEIEKKHQQRYSTISLSKGESKRTRTAKKQRRNEHSIRRRLTANNSQPPAMCPAKLGGKPPILDRRRPARSYYYLLPDRCDRDREAASPETLLRNCRLHRQHPLLPHNTTMESDLLPPPSSFWSGRERAGELANCISRLTGRGRLCRGGRGRGRSGRSGMGLLVSRRRCRGVWWWR